MAAIPQSAKLFMSGLIERARKLKKTIVFPEGTDARVLEAAARLAREGVVKPVLIGARPANAPEGVEFVDPATSPLVKKYAALYYERRRAKGTTQVEAAAVAKKPLYFASLMVGAGDADGSVGGAVNSTAETVRAALHAVGVHPRARLVQFDALHLPFRPDSDWFYERIAVRNMPRGRNGDWTRYPDILLKWRLYGQPESRCNSGSVEGGRHCGILYRSSSICFCCYRHQPHDQPDGAVVGHGVLRRHGYQRYRREPGVVRSLCIPPRRSTDDRGNREAIRDRPTGKLSDLCAHHVRSLYRILLLFRKIAGSQEAGRFVHGRDAGILFLYH